MTREEAIADIRDNIKPVVGGISLDMAIKALETVSCIKEKCAYCPHCENCDVDDETLEIKALEQQPCEDCISRQAVLDGVDRYIYKSQSTGTQDDFYSFAELVVKELPSVTPKEKTGKWIMTSAYFPGAYGNIHYVKCSCCNEYNLGKGNYCPNCGARMFEPQESKEDEEWEN